LPSAVSSTPASGTRMPAATGGMVPIRSACASPGDITPDGAT
jgi:hypothetical protein